MVVPALKRTLLPLGLLLLVFLFIHACVPEPISDLRLLDVRRVPASALPSADDLRGRLMQRGGALWKVTLEGDANWIREVRQHELNGYATVVRCDERDYGMLTLGPYVEGVEVSYYGKGFARFDPPAARTRRYDVYIPERGRYRSEADFNAPLPAYNLARERLQLCIRIAGGAMHGAYNRSNEVRAPVGASG